MTPQGKEALTVVDGRCAELISAATNGQVRAKLGNLNEVCRVLVVEAAQRLTVPEVVRHYKARFPAREHSLAESSIRNKRNGANPYAVLYAAWEGAAEFLLSPPRQARRQAAPGEMLSTDDLAGIADTALRHRVSLVLAQNRSLKSQLDILKRAERGPVVCVIGPETAPAANQLALTETEVEAVRNFLDPRQLRARGLQPAEDGAIETRDGRRLADPGFNEALGKIVRSYEPAESELGIPTIPK